MSHSFQDVEEKSDGTILHSSDIELVNDGGNENQVIGLEFTNLGILAGAGITSANNQLASDKSNSNTDLISLSIKADDNPNPTNITSGNFNLINRTTISNSVNWLSPFFRISVFSRISKFE